MATVASRKGRPTAADSGQKVAAVLAAAREEFSRRGYRAVTMRGVAEKAQVSTRTLYNHYADKLSLFAACLDFGAVAFPKIAIEAGEAPADALRRYAARLVEMLASDASLRMGMLVYREGADFPELVAAAEANQEQYLVQPLAAFLRGSRLAGDDAIERARLFNAMAASQWQRAVIFGHAMPDRAEIAHHAALVVHIFLDGASTSRGNSGEDRS